MKRISLLRKTGLNRTKGINHTSTKTAKRNGKWKQICLERADYLIRTYGFIICEYSGEIITTLSSVPNSPDEGWGHHIDKRRSHCDLSNCYIVKYKYHSLIHDKNIKVKQEGFEGVLNEKRTTNE